MSGWQSEEEYLVEQCTAVLARVEAKFPSGTLWVLNRTCSRLLPNNLLTINELQAPRSVA